MKRYLTNVLILSSLLMVFSSCGSLRHQGYIRKESGEKRLAPVFGAGFDKALYNVRIAFGDNVFTGLAVIKKMPGNNSYRLALLSEAGLRLFEAEFPEKGEPVVNYITDFLNKRAVVKKLSSDFSLLFPEPESAVHRFFVRTDETGNFVLRVKTRGKNDYFYKQNKHHPVMIKQRGFPFGRTTVFIGDYLNDSPQTIVLKHKMLKLEITLTDINYKEWN